MLEDLTMLATLPVDQSAVKKAEDEDRMIEKAAASNNLPRPKDKDEDSADAAIRERGQDPPQHEDGDSSEVA